MCLTWNKSSDLLRLQGLGKELPTPEPVGSPAKNKDSNTFPQAVDERHQARCPRPPLNRPPQPASPAQTQLKEPEAQTSAVTCPRSQRYPWQSEDPAQAPSCPLGTNSFSATGSHPGLGREVLTGLPATEGPSAACRPTHPLWARRLVGEASWAGGTVCGDMATWASVGLQGERSSLGHHWLFAEICLMV